MYFQCKKKISELTEENIRLRTDISKLKAKVYSEIMLQTDDDVNFYTGLPSKYICNRLHSLSHHMLTGDGQVLLQDIRTLDNLRKFL